MKRVGQFCAQKKPLNTMLQDTNRFSSVISQYNLSSIPHHAMTCCSQRAFLADIHCHLGTKTQTAGFGKPQLLHFCDVSLASKGWNNSENNVLLTVLLDNQYYTSNFSQLFFTGPRKKPQPPSKSPCTRLLLYNSKAVKENCTSPISLQMPVFGCKCTTSTGNLS